MSVANKSQLDERCRFEIFGKLQHYNIHDAVHCILHYKHLIFSYFTRLLQTESESQIPYSMVKLNWHKKRVSRSMYARMRAFCRKYTARRVSCQFNLTILC